MNSWCLITPLYGGLVSVSGSICVSSEFLAHRQQVCVSSGQRPVCSVMQRAVNRLVEGKVKDNLPPPAVSYTHYPPPPPVSIIPLPKSPNLPTSHPVLISPPLLQCFFLLGQIDHTVKIIFHSGLILIYCYVNF